MSTTDFVPASEAADEDQFLNFSLRFLLGLGFGYFNGNAVKSVPGLPGLPGSACVVACCLFAWVCLVFAWVLGLPGVGPSQVIENI